MTKDIESPLLMKKDVAHFKPEELINCLYVDDDSKLQRLIDDWGYESVLNYQVHPGSGTAIHAAASKGAKKCLQKLLDTRRHPAPADIPDGDGNTPLFEAVKYFQVQSVELLSKSSIQINARNDQGHSILHWLVYSFRKGKESDQENLLTCLRILLSRRDIDLEPHDNSNLTPLLAAAEIIPPYDATRKSNCLVTCCKLLVSEGASLDAIKSSGETVRQILDRKKALTPVLMTERKPPPSRPFSSQLFDFLIQGANGDFITDRLANQPQEEANRLVNSFIGSQTILFYAVDQGHAKTVEELLDAGADPWKQQFARGETCLDRALTRGYYLLVDLLIKHMKNRRNIIMLDFKEDSFKLLKKVLSNFVKTKSSSEINHMKCLERLFESDIILDLNVRSGGLESITALHVAAAHNNQAAMQLLIEKGAFIGDPEEQKKILSVMRPATLNSAMDNCISYKPDNKEIIAETENSLNENYTLHLDYRFLCPPQEAFSSPPRNEVSSLMDLVKNKPHKQAASHPLIQVFLYAKWRKVLPLYVLNLLLYLIFVVLLTSYTYTLKDLRILEQMAEDGSFKGNITVIEEAENYRTTANILMAFLILLTIYMFIREIFQAVFSPKTYCKNFENYLEWALIVFVVVLCVVPLTLQWTRHLAAWSMIIAWYEFVLLLGRAPPLAIYVTMLRHVSWNFLKLIVLYGALLVAFTVSFNIILQPALHSEDSDFGDFWSSLPKAIVMATGEFEYSDLSKTFPNTLLFSSSTVFIFLVFLFLIFLVLMNVMNGLAVSDTQKVVNDAILYSLTSRLELIYLIEELLLKSPFFRRYLHRIQILAGSSNPELIARVNHPKFSERIKYGKHMDQYCKLDRNTANVLKTCRLKRLADEENALRDQPVLECLALLKEIRLWTEQLSSLHHGRIMSNASSRDTIN